MSPASTSLRIRLHSRLRLDRPHAKETDRTRVINVESFILRDPMYFVMSTPGSVARRAIHMGGGGKGYEAAMTLVPVLGNAKLNPTSNVVQSVYKKAKPQRRKIPQTFERSLSPSLEAGSVKKLVSDKFQSKCRSTICSEYGDPKDAGEPDRDPNSPPSSGDEDRATYSANAFDGWEPGTGDMLRGGVGVEEPDEFVD
ncbi:hypothetical protein CLCR_11290 [Cladophialophora carrionii]|uniref:Uncharacterized protein n=1 Tax=Cladophialophora carrionii TaxID=86049 RepID=A0A1C1CIM2_9EURO|nr:hypothetical protein CLCR_11290 [Cladophialophora carrionii]